MRHRFLRTLLLLTALLLVAAPASAVIMKLTPLAEILEGDDYILVVAVDKVDPDKPSAVFVVEKKLKGEPPYERIPVNMAGNDEAKKAGDTKTILDRLDSTRKVVFFVSKRGKNHNAKAFVEGSWFSVHGVEDPADKVVRWSFQSGEPFLRRTYKGTSAELIKVIEDGLAKKAKPPAPNEKEKEGYGPAVEKKEPKKCDESFRLDDSDSSLALFGVIPSVVLLGPLAIIAALFPGVFAPMAIGMKRWRAFLVVASTNSTLALVYWLVITEWPSIVPGGWAFGLKAFTVYLTVIAAIGLSWAGRRYRRMVAEDPTLTNIPNKTEIYALAGLSAFAGLSALSVAWFADWQWRTNLDLPLREFTFIGISVFVATLYAGYRYLTRHVDHTPAGTPPDRRLSISGEMIGLGTLVLCGFTFLVASGSRDTVASGTETGDAEAIGPRFIDAKTFEFKKTTEVMSRITIVGDRLYFGTRLGGSTPGGHIICADRMTGEEKWRFGDDDQMLPVFSTPTVLDGKLYCGEGTHEDKKCRLFSVDVATGKPAWDHPIATTSHTEGAPAVAGGKVIFPAGDDGLIAVDAKTRAELWRLRGGKEAGIHIDASPAVSGNRVFVGSGLYTFVAVALDTDTGKELWRTDLKLRAFGAPLALGKHVYYGVGTGNLGADVHDYKEEGEHKDKEPAGAVVCLEAETGKEVWRFDLSRSVHAGLAGDGFSIYATARDGHVYAIDRKTGKLRWKTGIGAAITSVPAVATSGGLPVAVYAVSSEGVAVCLNPHTGKVVWQKPLPGFHLDEKGENAVLSGPTVVTTLTPTGSKRTIYIGAMTVDPDNTAKKTAAVFRFEDEIGGD